jgi:UDP-2-acetamido-3-amino-2,3-dideoxy-glucuronate N-acetyltransferase
MGIISESADVAASAIVPASASVWHYAQIREGAVLGENSIIGRGAYIGSGVTLGDNCKVQNYALVYEPASLGNGVFIGPNVVLTNDEYPRAVSADGTLKSASDWNSVGVTILDGASIGASATCVAPLTIGRWALVGSGSVVVTDVPDFALVVGNPARRIGWVGKSARRLTRVGSTQWQCPDSGDLYSELNPESIVEVAPS